MIVFLIILFIVFLTLFISNNEHFQDNNTIDEDSNKVELDSKKDNDDIDYMDKDDNEIDEMDHNDDLNLHYNTKKYYCNSYKHHKQLYPQTPIKMYLSRQDKKNKQPYYFRNDDICCVNDDPTKNFNRKYVKCCYFRDIDQKSIPKCKKYKLTT